MYNNLYRLLTVFCMHVDLLNWILCFASNTTNKKVKGLRFLFKIT